MTLLEIIQVQNTHLKAYFSDLDLLPDMEKARSCPGRVSWIFINGLTKT